MGSTEESSKQFNQRLMAAIGLVVLVVESRLFAVALEFDNWPGFSYSTLHVAVVAVGTFFALKRS